MPLAVTHIIIAIILADLYRDYIVQKKDRKNFTLHTVMIAGIAGLLPDIDVPLEMVFRIFGAAPPEIFQHGGITHTPFFGLIFLIPAFYFISKKNHKVALYFYMITFGILLHLFLDFILGGGRWEGIMLFWPISDMAFKIHIIKDFNIGNLPAALDALILLAWLYHEEAKHKIKDFI